jgi:hypothetical protein
VCNNGIDEDCNGQDCTITGDKKWQHYKKTGVSQNPDTYLPPVTDFGSYVGTIDDAASFPANDGNTVTAFRCWVYVAVNKSIPVCVSGDDGTALYKDGQFVCGRPNAEDPPNCGTLTLAAGWSKLEALVYNGPGPGSLTFDKKISDQVDALTSKQP